MNFVQQLEEYLRDLAAEARKKHPGVKEASERATLKLRSLQANYVAAVRMASSSSSSSGGKTSTTAKNHPTTSMFQSSVILHPFLLAANYPNADYKLISISFKAMRLLMEGDAIVPTDAIHMVRVYQIQAQVITAYFTKYYAKEIANQQQQLEAASLSDHGKNYQHEQDESEQADDYDESDEFESNDNHSAYSSWFSWGGTSSNTNKERHSVDHSSSTTSSVSSKAMTTLKNAVSSSSGQSGNQASISTLPQMEKLALEILSSLLQLVQLLQNYPSSLTDEIWTNSVSLACLWCSLLPPFVFASRTSTASQSNTVQQAAYSTLHQLICLLYEANSLTFGQNQNNKQSSTTIHHKFILQTWDDLLVLTASNKRDSNSDIKLSGVFQLCHKRIKSTENQRITTNSGSVAVPPSPELSLELMTQVWKDTSFMIKNTAADPKAYEESLFMTMGVTMALLQQISKQQTSVEKSLRTIQWTAVLLQSHSRHYPNECCELLMYMINKQLPLTTTACRKHHDFEDGYIYTLDEAFVLQSDVRNNTSTPNSHIDSALSSSTTSRDSLSKHPKNNVQPLTSCFPSHLIWKTGFLLELMYHIMNKENLCVRDDSELALLFVMDDVEKLNRQKKATLQSLTEAISDFATVGSSCRDHIIQVVEFCYLKSNSSYKPNIVRTAENIISSGNSSIYFSTNVLNSSSRNTSEVSKVSLSKKMMDTSSTCPVLGEAIWMALQITLRIVQCLKHNLNAIGQPKELLDEIFPSSLAVFQHFMKRFIACEELVRLTLKGYTTLADVCLTMIAMDGASTTINSNTSMQRCVLLSSLSKLSLPSWGKFDSTNQLQDHHVLSLLSLLRIIHSHYNQIGTDYEIILKTFEELSTLSIASRSLSDEIYHSSLALAAVFSRFAGLSTCMSSDSLQAFIEALTRICEMVLQDRDIVGDSETVLPERMNQRPHSLSESSERNVYNHEGRDASSTIGGKLMSIGVRAIYGSSTTSGSGEDNDRQNDVPKAERTKNVYYQDYRDDFIRRISISNVNIRLNSFGRIPFCLILLADATMANMFRQEELGEFFASEFFQLSSSRPIVRPFIMDVMTMQIMSSLSDDDKFTDQYPGKLVFEDPMQSQLLAVEPDERIPSRSGRKLSQGQVLGSLCRTIITTTEPGVASSALGVLNSVLEGTGENLEGDVWSLVIDSIASLSGGLPDHTKRVSSEWSGCCLMAFKCLKLIVDDFLDSLLISTNSNVRTNVSLLECCSSFVISQHDINTSLTAIGLLWTIADKDTESSSVDRALSTLVELSSDDRTEIRNAAVNTLFSCIAGRGNTFEPEFWKTCITDTILKVYAVVLERSRVGLQDELAKDASSVRYKVAFHHSRDSRGKQWVVTQVLVLRGLTRILRSFFTQLLDSVTIDQDEIDSHDLWLEEAWVRILDYAFDAAGQLGGRENLDLRSSGVELLVVCCQLASKSGIQAAISPAKVSTKMEVVNGALRNVRDADLPRGNALGRSYSLYVETLREKLFVDAFESLEILNDDILKTRQNPDDVDLQLLFKHCSNLAKLYECCKDNEFVTDSASRSLRLFNASEEECQIDFRQDLEGRFTLLIDSLLQLSSCDTKSKFLNQCQRCAIDLLQLMASAGSASAFCRLTTLAGVSFFIRREMDDPDASSTENDYTIESPSLISFEMASSVSREIQNLNVSDECKIWTFYKAMHNFMDEVRLHQQQRRRRYYKNFVPMIEVGLQSTRRLVKSVGTGKRMELADMVLERFYNCLKEMLNPVPVGRDMKKIPRVPELLTIITCATTAVSTFDADHYRHHEQLSSVLATGALHALDVATDHAIRSSSERSAPPPNSEIGRKSKRHREELLKLFDSCFSGSCSLNPDDKILRSCATVALSSITSLSNNDDTNSEEMEAKIKVSVEASLLICDVLVGNKTKVDGLILSIFSYLCKLISIPTSITATSSGSDQTIAIKSSTTSNNNNALYLVRKQLADAIQNVFVEVNVADVLNRTRDRYELAEKQARDAMDRVASLEAAVEELQYEKELLLRQQKQQHK